MDVENPKGSIFQFFVTVRLFSKNFSQFGPTFGFSGTVKGNTWHFEVFMLFLSLRYGVDICRSRLVNLYWLFFASTWGCLLSRTRFLPACLIWYPHFSRVPLDTIPVTRTYLLRNSGLKYRRNLVNKASPPSSEALPMNLILVSVFSTNSRNTFFSLTCSIKLKFETWPPIGRTKLGWKVSVFGSEKDIFFDYSN